MTEYFTKLMLFLNDYIFLDPGYILSCAIFEAAQTLKSGTGGKAMSDVQHQHNLDALGLVMMLLDRTPKGARVHRARPTASHGFVQEMAEAGQRVEATSAMATAKDASEIEAAKQCDNDHEDQARAAPKKNSSSSSRKLQKIAHGSISQPRCQPSLPAAAQGAHSLLFAFRARSARTTSWC